MNEYFTSILLQSVGATHLQELEIIQSLWSGYGKIVRYALQGSIHKTVVVKHVQLKQHGKHPRGWTGDIGHQRKLKSYEVEAAWYANWSKQCTNDCRVPECYALEQQGDEVLMVLEDLDASGFPLRKDSVDLSHIRLCLDWLAAFHATFLGQTATDLWPVGTYWHLDTRPEELEALTDLPLKKAAQQIDQLLQESPYQTLVHGDAKLANFCFSADGKAVAGVDFQYIGRGCGMKDVAYFLGSCLYEEDCERYEQELLHHYFKQLKQHVEVRNLAISVTELEANWRALYPVAWTDFHRFMKGWSSGHWKINSYSERLAHEVVTELNLNQ